MKRYIFLLVFVLAAAVIIAWAYGFFQKNTRPATTQSKLSSDLYPLYAGADWNMPGAESFMIGTSSYSGANIKSASIPAGMNPDSIITPFSKYYESKLKNLGWSVANDLAAGGHTGGQEGYRKDGKAITAGFQIDYQSNPDNAPSECPCNVTLSLFSEE